MVLWPCRCRIQHLSSSSLANLFPMVAVMQRPFSAINEYWRVVVGACGEQVVGGVDL